MSVKLNIREIADVTVVDVSGRITGGDASSAVRNTLRRLLAGSKKKLLLNLNDVKSIDSSGIRELVLGFTTVTNAGGTLKLLGLSKRLKEEVQAAIGTGNPGSGTV